MSASVGTSASVAADASPRVPLGAVLTALTLLVLPYSLVTSASSPALPAIRRELDTDPVTASWVMTGFLLSAAVATPILGKLGDSYGKRKVLIVVSCVFGIGLLLGGLAWNIETLIAARVIQGTGGGLLPLMYGLIRESLSRHQVAGAVGAVAAINSVGYTAGLMLAGPITDWIGYRWLFFLPAIAAMLGMAAGLFLLKELPRQDRQRVPLLAAALLSLGLLALLLAITSAPGWGWSSARTLTCFIVAVLLLSLWVRVEWTSTSPLLDLRIMRLRGIWTSNVIAFTTGLTMFGFTLNIPLLLQEPTSTGFGFGASVSSAGWILMPMAAISIVGGLLMSPVMRSFGLRFVAAASSFMTAAGSLWAAAFHDSWWQVLVAVALSGVGTAFGFPCIAQAVVLAAPAHMSGVVAGTNTNIRLIGGAVGIAVTASLVAAGTSAQGQASEWSYTASFVVVGSASLIAAAIALLMPGLDEHAASR